MEKHTKKFTVGILAHVDAGKTTLSEYLLLLGNVISHAGRVDKQNTFLDHNSMERKRGITIFSKQAILKKDDIELTLMDTPGHVDFSGEMERVLSVLDYAILVISGADGIQGHTLTLWKLLASYQIPCFLFINKMDQPGTDREKVLLELQKELSDFCLDFTSWTETTSLEDSILESISLCEESLLDVYLENGEIPKEDIIRLIRERQIFPCYFGSALKGDHVEDFFYGLLNLMEEPKRPEKFGASVFKITRDEQGKRLTHMKITGGSLKVKTLLSNKEHASTPDALWEEKVDQIRIYSGTKYEAVPEASAGTICAVTGLTAARSGEGIGDAKNQDIFFLKPVLTYQILLPEGTDPAVFLKDMRILEEEDPLLHVVWNDASKEIHVQVMGEVQIEILQNVILERFHVPVSFSDGSILYKETIAEPVEGVGHYEPLRHYAEVHLVMEPGEPGSGLTFESRCSEDFLDRNWQRLIFTHIAEKQHKGVLTGSELTDVHFVLTAGRAHLKHTEGGDFRQSTYRAIRHGLMKAQSVLLEPVFEFTLEVPSTSIGRAMTDIQKMHGTFSPPELVDDFSVLRGKVPVATCQNYQRELIAYTNGRGRMSCTLSGYEPCHNTEEVLEQIGYDPELDTENPSGSVFCSHGAGFYVPWQEVESFMHLPLSLVTEEPVMEEAEPVYTAPASPRLSSGTTDKELMAIFERTYGPSKNRSAAVTASAPVTYKAKPVKEEPPATEYLLVDGYNIIFAWEELADLAKDNIDGARTKLMDILSNYQGYRKCNLILVFDAYKVQGGLGEMFQYHNIHVVYTKEAETADQYIEKTAHRLAKQDHVTVATSDGLIQLIILGSGAVRMSAAGLKEEIQIATSEMRQSYRDTTQGRRTFLFDALSDETNKELSELSAAPAENKKGKRKK